MKINTPHFLFYFLSPVSRSYTTFQLRQTHQIYNLALGRWYVNGAATKRVWVESSGRVAEYFAMDEREQSTPSFEPCEKKNFCIFYQRRTDDSGMKTFLARKACSLGSQTHRMIDDSM